MAAPRPPAWPGTPSWARSTARLRLADLARALGLAAQGDGSLLLATADALNGRKPDGEYSNEAEANSAVNCVDEPAPTDPAAYMTLAQQLLKTAPRVGRVLAATGLTCAFWPVHPTAAPAPINAAGAPPIVVIGAPATRPRRMRGRWPWPSS